MSVGRYINNEEHICQKMNVLKMRRIIGSQLVESTKVSFECNSNLGISATLMSDIPKLGETAGLIKRGYNEQPKSKFQN